MKKLTIFILLAIGSSLSSIAAAAQCSDLNGVWKGTLGEATVQLNLNINGYSTLDLNSASFGWIGSTCEIKNGIANLSIWHQINNDKGTDWFRRIIVEGQLENPKELFIKSFKYMEHNTGVSLTGAGVLLNNR